MQCLILAGGLGTRMNPATLEIPKSLLPVNGRPFIDHQLRWLSAEGVDDVLLCIGHLGRQIEDHVGDGQAWDVRVRYSVESGDLLGTAGCIRQAVEAGLTDDGFFVLYGDSYLPIAFAPVWQAAGQGTQPLMTVYHNNGRFDSSNVVFKDGAIERYEKGRADAAQLGMEHIDYGLSVLTRDIVLKQVPSQGSAGGRADLADVFHRLSRSGRLAGFEVDQRFYEIGSPQGLAELEAYLAGP